MRKPIKQYALATVLIVAVVAIVVVVVYLAKGEKVSSILINKNTMLAGAGTVYVPATSASAYIATPSAVNANNSQYSCDGVPSPRCEILSVASESHTVMVDELLPYGPRGAYTLTTRDTKNYTSRFASWYGLSSCTQTVFFGSKVNKTISRYSCTGPKGYTSDPIERPGPPMDGASIDTSARGDAVSYGTYGGGTRTVDVYTPTETYSVSYQSSKLLVMKGNPAVKYKVTLSTAASLWFFNSSPNFGTMYVNPRVPLGKNGIPCHNIRIIGKTPDNKCRVSVLLNGGETLDITPIALVPSYASPFYDYTVSVVSVEEPAPSKPSTTTQ